MRQGISLPHSLSQAPVSQRRRRRQKGVEAIEFGLFFIMMLPGFVWMFISGMNFIRFNKANDVARATALMYIKGQDMNVLGTQEIVARVGQGLDLEVDDGTPAPNQVMSNTRGSGLVVLSQVQYVGPNTCSNCNNLNHYVFLHRVYIGNRSLEFNGTSVQSALGDPAAAVWSASTGAVTNVYTDTRAQVNSTFGNLWSPAVGDGQIVYVVESFFSGGFGTGDFGGSGVYARVFM